MLAQHLNREVYVWYRLNHANIAKLLGSTYHMGGRPAIVMEWYKNGSAMEYLRSKNPEADRLKLVGIVYSGCGL
jgi:serine/threonine protein kinase